MCNIKGTEQLHNYHAADQCLCFPYMDSKIPLLPKSEISSHALKPDVCLIWSETPEDRFFSWQGSNVKQKQKTLKHLSRVVRKPFFCICENKDADQLRGNREADQRLCFRHTASAIPLLSKYEISSL